ncbi:hypothetical protein [Haloarchaeobius sp. DT45]|uniref:hypothetical protein n=1 Tax=Haloarchaeobius sp. DT45 TaxID=3446116 RepID=UPI003F6D563D
MRTVAAVNLTVVNVPSTGLVVTGLPVCRGSYRPVSALGDELEDFDGQVRCLSVFVDVPAASDFDTVLFGEFEERSKTRFELTFRRRFWYGVS